MSPTKRSSTADDKSKKKARTETDERTKSLQTLADALELDEYGFPCHEVLSSWLPKSLGVSEENRSDFAKRGCTMIQEAVEEVTRAMQKTEEELQHKCDNTETVRSEIENNVKFATVKIAALEVKIEDLRKNVDAAKEKLIEDEEKLSQKRSEYVASKDQFIVDKDARQELEEGLEKFYRLTSDSKSDQPSKMKENFLYVLKQYFPEKVTLLEATKTLLRLPNATDDFDKLTIQQVCSALQDKLAAYEEKSRHCPTDEDVRNAEEEVKKSRQCKVKATGEWHDLCKQVRELAKSKEKDESTLENFPQQCEQWQKDLVEHQARITEFKDTVVTAMQFLLHYTEAVPEVENVEPTDIVLENTLPETEEWPPASQMHSGEDKEIELPIHSPRSKPWEA